MASPRHHADVAELADAQVSEACDGDIVEVQVLSSAPTDHDKSKKNRSYRTLGPIFLLKIIVTHFRMLVFW